eukprot:GDKH01016534.1.p3 GENE.GDKH01016534.1~~GDKH01016534.1.p3  ORF type:complete len:51 (-),score=2.30 GDKH01016534.1:226-378(-)
MARTRQCCHSWLQHDIPRLPTWWRTAPANHCTATPVPAALAEVSQRLSSG